MTLYPTASCVSFNSVSTVICIIHFTVFSTSFVVFVNPWTLDIIILYLGMSVISGGDEMFCTHWCTSLKAALWEKAGWGGGGEETRRGILRHYTLSSSLIRKHKSGVLAEILVLYLTVYIGCLAERKRQVDDGSRDSCECVWRKCTEIARTTYAKIISARGSGNTMPSSSFCRLTCH